MAAAVMVGCVDIVGHLITAGADHQTPVQCLDCGGVDPCGACVIDCLNGKTPAENANAPSNALRPDGEKHMPGFDNWLTWTIRKRRTTPVKARAAKLGIDLPPTPTKIREDLESEDVELKKEAKRLLQRHQKACHQVVDRAEKEKENLDNPGEPMAIRRQALDAQIKARSKRKCEAAAAASGKLKRKLY